MRLWFPGRARATRLPGTTWRKLSLAQPTSPSLRAKRSNSGPRKRLWIASSRSLSSGAHSRDPLAPRNDGKHASTFSRHEMSEVLEANRPPIRRGRRECRMRVAPVAACAVKKHRRQQLQVHRNSRHSLRDGFNGVLRALLGDHAWLPPSFAEDSATLAPASERQDHTTSPSAQTLLVHANELRSMTCVHRIPFPTSVTTAKRPSSGNETRERRPLIWG